jgi:protein SCO1
MVRSNLVFTCLLLACAHCQRPAPEFQKAIGQFRADKLDHFEKLQMGLPYYTRNVLDPIWDSSSPDIIVVPQFSAVDQNGVNFDAQVFQNQMTLVSFFFTRCSGYCPGITRNLKRVYDKLHHELPIRLVSFSVTPQLDSPRDLKVYSEKWQLPEGRWILATGKRDEIYELARETFNADTRDTSKNDGDFIHSENVYLVDNRRRIRAIFNGNFSGNVPQIVAAVRLLAAEKSVH